MKPLRGGGFCRVVTRWCVPVQSLIKGESKKKNSQLEADDDALEKLYASAANIKKVRGLE